MAERTPAQISQEIFNLYTQAGDGGGRLTKPAIIALIGALGYAGPRMNPERVNQVVDMIDPTGTLDIRGFRRFLTVFDSVLRDAGYGGNNLLIAMKELLGYGGGPPPQDVVVPVAPVAPLDRRLDAKSIIPGTGTTYLNLALYLRPAPRAPAVPAGCMHVHRYLESLTNAPEALRVLDAATRTNPLRANPGQASAEYSLGIDNYLSRSENPAFRDPVRRRFLMTLVMNAINRYEDARIVRGGLDINARDIIMFSFLFMQTLAAYPEIQTAWAVSVYQDSIEAYSGVTLDSVTAESGISCPAGVFERHLTNIAGAIFSQARNITDEDLLAAKPHREYLQEWIQEYSDTTDEPTRDGFREFVRGKVATLRAPDNDMARWSDEEIVETMDGLALFGGKRKRKRRTYRKRKSTRAKRLR